MLLVFHVVSIRSTSVPAYICTLAPHAFLTIVTRVEKGIRQGETMLKQWHVVIWALAGTSTGAQGAVHVPAYSDLQQ